MGAGLVMRTSIAKTANFIVRLHMAVEIAKRAFSFGGAAIPINDGIFLISKTKREICSVLRYAMVLQATNLISIPRPHDRSLVRGAISFGPVYHGVDLRQGIARKRLRDDPSFFQAIAFGPAIISAYQAESHAVPFGIAVHESARAFAPAGERPFRLNHWLWWQSDPESDPPPNAPPLTVLRDRLLIDLTAHFDWMKKTTLFNELTLDKIETWKRDCAQYFAMG
jgi:hypothetical protein